LSSFAQALFFVSPAEVTETLGILETESQPLAARAPPWKAGALSHVGESRKGGPDASVFPARVKLWAKLLALASVLVLAVPSEAGADQLVKFVGATGGPVQGYLTKPRGAGPFPAVVLLHSCLGLPSNRRAIESALSGAGFVALFVDEFSTRGLTETCTVDFPQLGADAFGALAFLAALPQVDSQRVAVVGFSQGGDGALVAAASPAGAAHGLPDGIRFRAAAAFYPPCANQAHERLSIPTLILVGEADEVTPAPDCRRLAEGQPDLVRLSVYPGAGHCFDDPAFAGGKRLLGMTLRYDPSAAQRGMAELIAFLHASLAR
jgi:dienelactone hydrolase